MIDNQVLKDLKEKTEGVEHEIKRLEAQLMQTQNDKNEFEREIAFNLSLINTKEEEITAKNEANVKLEQDKELFKKEIEELNKKTDVLKEEIAVIEEKLGELLKQRDEINAELIEMEKQKHIRMSDIERIGEQIESFKARRRELEPQLDNAKKELEDSGVEINKLEPVEMSVDEITSKIQRLDKKMQELGDVNMRALTTYEEKLARH